MSIIVTLIRSCADRGWARLHGPIAPLGYGWHTEVEHLWVACSG